jgi:hypothetical protein
MSTDAARAAIQAAQQSLQQALAALAPSGLGVTTIRPGDNFLALLADAPAGSVFQLDPSCLFLTPSLVISKPVSIVSSVEPPPARVGSAWAGPILRGDVTVTAPGTILTGLRFEGAVKEATILSLGPTTAVDRCVVLGSVQGQHRGIEVNNAAGWVLRRSWVGNIWADIDAQAVAGDYGVKNGLIDDCYLEASGETVIFGGSDSPSAGAIPQDLAITNSTLTKQLAWQTQAGVTVKGLLELKCVQRFRMTGCELAYTWKSGQDGYALVLTVRNQSGAAPWSTIEDVTIHGNDFVHMAGGINILGSDDTFPSGQMARVSIDANTFGDINPGVWGANGRQVMIGGGPQNLALTGNIFAGVGLNSALTFSNAVPKNPLVSNQCKALLVSGNTFQEGDYGIIGDGAPGLGVPALEMYASGFQWAGNTIVKGSSGRAIPYPAGTVLA